MLGTKSPIVSYFIGFVQGDGHLKKSGTAVDIHLSIKDKDIIDKFVKEIVAPNNLNYTYSERTYDTNFKKGFKSCDLSIRSKDLVKFLNVLGVPCGRKSDIIKPPTCEFSEVDYLRGLIDADGAVGLTKLGLPFITLVVSSEEIKNFFYSFIIKVTGEKKKLNRNKRDNIYNIAMFREHAQTMINLIYYNNCFGLERKITKAKEALSWRRHIGLKRISHTTSWDSDEDKIVLSEPLEMAMNLLNRSAQSIKMRKWRLENKPRTKLYWTGEEDALLLSNTNNKEIAKILNRTTCAIEHRRARLK